MPPIRSEVNRIGQHKPAAIRPGQPNPKAKPVVKISLEQPTIEVVPTDTVHIASGGQSSVYGLGPECILRELSTQPGSPEYVQELEIAHSFAGRKFSGVANVLDVGDGYVVMERASGAPLSELVRSYPNEIMPPRLAAQIIQKTALALEEISRAGMVHRDIKPDNIMVELGANGEVKSVKLIDIFASAHQNTTGASDGVLRAGTPTYASPEQLHDGTVTEKSDIYSLGKVFYRLLTGKRLFEGHRDGMVRATLDVHIANDHPALQAVPAWLRERLTSMLSLSPAVRPSAGDLDLLLDGDLLLNTAPEAEPTVRTAQPPDQPAGRPKATPVEDVTVNDAGKPDLTVRVRQGNINPNTVIEPAKIDNVDNPFWEERAAEVAEPTVRKVPVRNNSAPKVESNPGRAPITYRGLATGFGGLAIPMGVGFGTYYGLGALGVEHEGVKAVASLGTGHLAGVGFTRLMTGRVPGVGAQFNGLALGLGGGIFANRVYNDALTHAGVDQSSGARSAPAQFGVGLGGGILGQVAGKAALPFAVVAIANEVPKYVQSPENYQAKVSEVEQARQRMAYLATHRDGLESVVATVALGLSLVPIFDGLVTLASDAKVEPARANPPAAPDRLTPAERAAQVSPALPKTPVNPLPLQTSFIPGFGFSSFTIPSRF
ncbi:MAG: serine/threonine-protein kinase [Syntrophales bacterium]